jgi:hypothetical protein
MQGAAHHALYCELRVADVDMSEYLPVRKLDESAQRVEATRVGGREDGLHSVGGGLTKKARLLSTQEFTGRLPSSLVMIIQAPRGRVVSL